MDNLTETEGHELNKRYMTSVCVLHSIMFDHLEELNFQGASTRFKKQIPLIMVKERKTRVEENGNIRVAVDDFFRYCRSLTPGSTRLIERFHILIMVMMREVHVKDVVVNAFHNWMFEVDVQTLKNYPSIKNLFEFVQGVKYVPAVEKVKERRVDDGGGGVLEAGSGSQENEEP